MNVTIRPAADRDIKDILAIVNHAITNTTAIYDYEPRTIEMQKEWFEEKSKSGFPVIVSEEQGQITGFATYGTFRQKTGYRFTIEHSVYVSTEKTGKGTGSMLMKELIQLAKSGGYHVMIGAIDASNTGSIDFHRRFGFIQCGTMKEVGFKFNKWLNVALMQLKLD
ncbi:MAG TPA: GNAT family N-acetyltransferase [Flavobacterium sp.]|jgi:phosphinothricin acetyltransferase